MTQTPDFDRYQEVRQRLEDLDDAVIVRVQAVMDIINQLHQETSERFRQTDERFRQTDERIAQLTSDINELKQLQANSIVQADADRAVMMEMLRYLRNQYPGNGNPPTQ